MGCGASSAVQIAPMTESDLIASQDKANDSLSDKTTLDIVNDGTALPVNGYPPSVKPGFKSRLFQSSKSLYISSAQKQTIIASLVSIGIQTEDYFYGIKSQYSQTDIQLSAEEEMDLIMTETSVVATESAIDQDSADGRVSQALESDTEVDKSVLVQTEESVLSRKANQSKKGSQYSAQVTIDVGIQVRKQSQSCATQTRLGFVHSSKTKLVPKVFNKTNVIATNLRKSMSVDTDNYRLWTAPAIAHHSDAIDSLNIISLNNNNILQDIESQTDPKLSSVLAANAAGSDLTAVVHSFDISSPFAHIERELIHKNNFLKVPDNRLHDCLSKLLDDMDDTFRSKANSGQSPNGLSYAICYDQGVQLCQIRSFTWLTLMRIVS